jgi:hypothetical protein
LDIYLLKHYSFNDWVASVKSWQDQLLAGRYSPHGHFIRSWDSDRSGWLIVDSMLNIPLLLDEIANAIEKQIESNAQIVILGDIAGKSVCNTCLQLTTNPNVVLVTGTNLFCNGNFSGSN